MSYGIMAKQGIIFDIKKYSLHDGPGIRTTVFLKGCPLACWWCHNPESQIEGPFAVTYPGHKQDFYTRAEDGQSKLGRTMTVPEVMAELEKDRLFYDESGGGVTFSGGEPLMQPEFLLALLAECREKDLHTCVDTTGYAGQEVIGEVMQYAGLFLYDLKLIDDDGHTKYTGVSNGPILDNLAFLAGRGAHVIIRIPIVPGITDSRDNLEGIAAFLKRTGGIREINLLPYNRFGSNKYRRLGRPDPMPATNPPTAEEMNRIAAFFTGQGFACRAGG
ncbi:glycyl-radical enzyme activating protein [bacterium]|nr:glycyl-radical enzyme activating protein [bacterium]